MLDVLHFGRRRAALIKGTLLIVVLGAVALFAVVNHDEKVTGTKDRPVFDMKKREGPIFPGPCEEYEFGFQCRPMVFLVGFQFAGLDNLCGALDLHPDIDCYNTVAEEYKILTYHSLFEESAKAILNGSDKLICDSGRFLARTYDLFVHEDTGEVLSPEYTLPGLLMFLYYYEKKVILNVGDPTVRFVREYCSRRIADNFDDYVDQSIADYLACENNATRNNGSCVYDASLSGLLQAGLYNFLLFADLVEYGGIAESLFHPVFLGGLEDSASRYNTMTDVFIFLEKDVPGLSDAYWGALDSLFTGKPPGCYCHGQNISDAAKTKLDTFYLNRSDEFFP